MKNNFLPTFVISASTEYNGEATSRQNANCTVDCTAFELRDVIYKELIDPSSRYPIERTRIEEEKERGRFVGRNYGLKIEVPIISGERKGKRN